MKNKLLICIITLICLMFSSSAMGIERRRSQFSTDFSHFVYPVYGKIPGVGEAAGAGVTLGNIFNQTADFTAIDMHGDFDVTSLMLLDLHLIPEVLAIDMGGAKYRAAVQRFSRGINSDKDDYMLPELEGNAALVQLTLMLFDKQLQVFSRTARDTYKVNKVLDADGNEFANQDKEPVTVKANSIGFKVDWTDDYQDPRKGIRFGYSINAPVNDDKYVSDYFNQEYNLTLYVPFGQQSTWTFTYFQSNAVVTSKATTNREELRQAIGLGCDQISEASAKEKCETVENKRLDERIALNTYGNAIALGGTQRLRSFKLGRYFAGNTQFFGTEFRWNLTDEKTPFDLFFMKGVRTGVQLAAFAEAGTVFDDVKQSDTFRHSYGVGARIILEGVTLRLDVATGEEGTEVVFFIAYPWSLFSVDKM